MSGDTIFALSTGPVRAAIAVVRLSGPATRFAVETLAGAVPVPRRASLRRLKSPGNRAVLDEALVLWFPGPASETGEDMAEFQLHGGRAVVAAVLGALGRLPGLRPAEPGEFARRALENGRMDLLDAEALADLIDAETEAQRRQAVEGAGSLLRGRVDRWREMVLDIRADLETGIDFSDEGDVQSGFESDSERLIRTLVAEMDHALAEGDRGERLREGFRVVLAGPPNAGKSSLLNALAGREVAIVSAIPGTTRDRIEVMLDLGGVPVIVTDTAGLRESDDTVEIEGVRRTREAMASADLVLWLSPRDAPSHPGTDFSGDVKVLLTKFDLAAGGDDPAPVWASISVHSGAGLETLLAQIQDVAMARFGSGEPALLTRARHRENLGAVRAALGRAAEVRDAEFQAEEIRLAERSLSRLVGRVDVEDVLGAIFSRFCIGK